MNEHHTDHTQASRQIGRAAALAPCFFGVAYAFTLTIGLVSLKSPQEPIRDPFFSLMELLMSVCAGITSSVHFVVLTDSRQVEFTSFSWLPLFLSFKWPSVIYALDILAWDWFYGLSMLAGGSYGNLEGSA